MLAESDGAPLVEVEIVSRDDESLSIIVTKLEGDPTINFTVI
jgi:hypothetical protein